MGTSSTLSLSTASITPKNLPIIEFTGDSSLISAITANTALPDSDIELGKITAKASGTDTIPFGAGAGQVTFSGSGSVYAGLALYNDPEKLLDDLSITTDATSDGYVLNLGLPSDGAKRFVVLRWGYNVAGNVSGSMAFAPYGSVSFGVDGKREALYAVIRQMDKTVLGRDAIQQTVDSWVMPRSAADPASTLASGTWLVAETDSQLAANLAATLGYDFNWVRQVGLAGLSGDIGLRIQLGLTAALGITLAGRYCAVVSQEPDAPAGTIRLRVFKLSKKGWNFALNLSADVTPSETILPAQLDDFIKAVFGTHGSQVLKDLNLVRQWTDPKQPLSGLLAGVSLDYAEKFLQAVGATAIFDENRKRLLGFLDQWEALPHEVNSLLWRYLPEPNFVATVKDIAATIANANQDTVKAEIEKLFQQSSFPQNPVFQWIEAAAAGPLLSVLEDSVLFHDFQKVAARTLAVLDGSEVEKLLTRLRDEVDKRLDLKQIETFAADPAKIDEWLRAKLADLLHVAIPQLDGPKITKIRTLISTLLAKGGDLYQKAIAALNRKYSFDLGYNYDQSDTRTAMLDVSFSLANARGLLKQALDGDFRQILLQQLPGVKINTAILTHNLNRHSHVELTLPFFKSSIDEINTSLGRVTAVDEDDGRLLIYELAASDTVVDKANFSTNRNSALSIGATFGAGNSAVRVHRPDSFDFTYSFRQLRKDMRRSEFKFQVGPMIDTYFPHAFGDNSGDPQRANFATWVTDWDKFTDANSTAPTSGSDHIGNTFLSLQLSFPSQAGLSWFQPAATAQPNYPAMSCAIQAALRQAILSSFLQNLSNLENITSPWPLLVYVSLPIASAISLDGEQLTLSTAKGLFWEYDRLDLLRGVASTSLTDASLQSHLISISTMLAGIPELKSTASRYTRDQSPMIVKAVCQSPTISNFLIPLLSLEGQVIGGAQSAFSSLITFAKQKDVNSVKAYDALTLFGLEITKTFNGQLSSVFDTSHVLRCLGTQIMVTAANALFPAVAQHEVDAILQVAVLKGTQLPDPDAGLTPAQVLLQQTLTSLGS